MESNSDTSYESVIGSLLALNDSFSLEKLDTDDRVLVLREDKAIAKSVFTKYRYRVLFLLEEDVPQAAWIQSAIEDMLKVQEKAIVVVKRLSIDYRSMKDVEALNRLIIEIEDLCELSENCQQKALMCIGQYKTVTHTEII